MTKVCERLNCENIIEEKDIEYSPKMCIPCGQELIDNYVGGKDELSIQKAIENFIKSNKNTTVNNSKYYYIWDLK